MWKLFWETNTEVWIQWISSSASLPEHNINLEKTLKNTSLYENNQMIKMWIEGWMCDFSPPVTDNRLNANKSGKIDCKRKYLWEFCKIINTCETFEFSY